MLAPLRGCFCIGYEMPPYLTDLLDRNAIPYLDIRLHPVRFLDDLLFGARASDPDTQAHLIDLAVPESLVHMTAGLREATCRHISEPRIPAGTLLVVGQKRYDSSQILDGAFFDAARHRDRIAAIGAEYAAIVLKPHPQDDTHTLLEVAASVCPNVLGVTRDNIYRMLAMPEVTGILTVSSSTAYEAPYFGKNVATLAPPRLRFAWRGDAPDPGAHVSLDDLLLSVDFWRGALAPYMRTTPVDGVRFPPKPNRLRIAFDSWWNFNEIDTDRLPARSGEVAKAQR
ncbi:MAG: hypothetical protein JO326_09560 [Acetobacteraceae bacterium]|nr:hypothetical protein [Acetobacteraceae bacterium]